jgi:hypothetical protein
LDFSEPMMGGGLVFYRVVAASGCEQVSEN